MKIIHGQDFYDNAHAGIDNEIVFLRDGVSPAAHRLESFPFQPRNYQSHHPEGWSLALAYVFYCGDVYPVMKASRWPAPSRKTAIPRSEAPAPQSLEFDFSLNSKRANKLIDTFYFEGFGLRERDSM